MNMSNPAAQVIGQAIFGPRPGGAPQGMMGTVMGSGLAGFASTVDAESIMVYNDRTNYSEWEFLLDPTKMLTLVFNPLAGTTGTKADQMNNKQPFTGGTGMTPVGTSPTGPGPIGR